MIGIIVMGSLMVAAAIILNLFGGKLDRRTLIYIAVFAFVSLVTGAGMWLLYTKAQTGILEVFFLALAVFFLAGLIHVRKMYRLLWAKRDTKIQAKDSFMKEAIFTIGLSALMVLLALAPFGYLVKKLEMVMSMYMLLLVFPLPFIIAKCFDFFSHIPGKEFDNKWTYETYAFDQSDWKKENMVNVGFIVSDSIANEKKWFNKKAKFTITVPRDQELRLIFRLALRAYHDKEPSVPVQELGYEENIEPFWWLFRPKFIPWKPGTWVHYQKYLDPNESLSYNNIRNGDFIKASRMLLNQNGQN